MAKISTMLLTVLLVFALSAFGQTSQDKAQKATDYRTQLQSLEQETQLKISALNDQIEKADQVSREDLDKQIMDIKQKSETQRLTILLEWAKAEGNPERIAEVQKALDNWTNPQQPQQYPTIDRSSATPGSQTTDANSKSSSSNK